MIVLVTGSAGKLGQVAVQALRAAGHTIRGFDRRETPGLEANSFIVGELTDFALIDQAFRGAEAVIHLAAAPDDANYPRGDPPNDTDNFLDQLLPANIVGAYHILEAARKHHTPRLILASTVQTVEGYLTANLTPVTVSQPMRPRYLYACTKVFLESIGRVYAEHHQLNVLSVRFGWCPRDEKHWQEIENDPESHDIYLSDADAGAFFTAAISQPWQGHHTVYCTSKPTSRLLFDLEPSQKLLNWAPQDRWPGASGTKSRQTRGS